MTDAFFVSLIAWLSGLTNIVRKWLLLVRSKPVYRIVVIGGSAAAVLCLIVARHSESGSSPSIAKGSTNSVPPAPNQSDGTGTAPMLLASRGSTNRSERHIAIVVGYGDAVVQARNAAEKLEPACSVIRSLTSGSFPESLPTRANIVRELSQLPTSAEGGHLVVFWAGEGACVNGQAYLMPQDSTRDVKDEGLSLERLSKAVAESKLNLRSRTLVLQFGRDSSSHKATDFMHCLLARPGDWQIVTNAQSWLESFENTNPQK